MHVEIWSDVACPWCYVGTRRFERAVEETGIDVDVVYRSFELDPTVPVDGDAPPLVDYLARKFGDPGRVAAAHHRLSRAGDELGIDFHWADMRRANTFDCHRLLAWALATDGPERQRALKKAMLRAYFTEGQVMTDHEVLSGLAAGVGLDGATALEVLESDRYADDVRAAREEAHRNGIAAVPTFMVEGRYMLQGALETASWVKALRHMADELAAR
ncbi:MAG TPA: DsbA family oxidoreductase [Acidimicrobiales bacterium]|jgi:predicted DsbA family dithiol-disulfide isomerase|nr:DsbA family oxidoreductase [Acidimicrobiales bacterium]